jgi:hypothetical protein
VATERCGGNFSSFKMTKNNKGKNKSAYRQTPYKRGGGTLEAGMQGVLVFSIRGREGKAGAEAMDMILDVRIRISNHNNR